MNAAALQPFLTTALPIMFTILIAAWMNNKGFDGINKSFDGVNRNFDGVHRRLDDISARLGRIEAKLDDHATRIATLEERTSPLSRSGR